MMRYLSWLALIYFAILSPRLSFGQTEGGAPDPRKSYDLGVDFGTLLSSRTGLTEPVPGWGIHAAIPTGKGLYELSTYFGAGNGIIYRSGAIAYRIDLTVETISAHCLLGFHADQFEATSPVPASSKFAGGWHYGGGIRQLLAGPLYLRADFKHRFSPGQSLMVTVGFSYLMGAGGSGSP